jgi:DNA invertase Pin-like site-specific DNA recombinase
MEPQTKSLTINLLDEKGIVRSYEEIEGDVIRIVRQHLKMNTSATARNLGISRETVYRIILRQANKKTKD